MDNSYLFSFFIVAFLLFLYLTLYDKIYLFPYLLTSNITNSNDEPTSNSDNEKSDTKITNIDI
jgi:hypothetical protein